MMNRRAFVTGGVLSSAALQARGQSASLAAHWIAPKGLRNQQNVFFRARKSFHLPAVPRSLTLQIAAESRYVLFVNGQVVGEGPARGSHTINFYDSYEIAPLLQNGGNWTAALVICMNVPSFKYAPAQPALLVQLSDRSVATDGSWEVQTAGEWRRDVPLYTHQTGFMEWRDMRREPAGWQMGEDGPAWDRPEIVAPANDVASKRLLARDIPQLSVTTHLPRGVPIVASVPAMSKPDDPEVARRLTEEAHEQLALPSAVLLTGSGAEPLVIPPQKGGQGVTLIADFERDRIGGFELDITAHAGTIVDVGYEEQIRDQRLKFAIGSYRLADRFVLRAGRQTVSNAHERGYRYLQLAFREFREPVRMRSLRAGDRRYPVVARGAFRCSDASLNSIFDACAATLSTCATDTFIDCPWRELSFWVNDLLVENAIFVQVFGDSRLNARCLRLALSERRPDGLIPVCPSNGNDGLVLVATNLFVPLMLDEYWLYTGDRTLVEELVPRALEILRTFRGWQDADGLVTPPPQFWNFVDWSYDRRTLDGKTTAVLSFFHVLALDATARLLRRLGRTEELEALDAVAGILEEVAR
jgi:hypothetical protein